MLAVNRAGAFRGSFHEFFLQRDPLARGGPHVRDVEVLPSVSIVIEPAYAHPRADIFDARLRGDVREAAAFAVSVKVVAPEIVDDVEVREAVAVVVAPAGGKTEPVIVLAHAG